MFVSPLEGHLSPAKSALADRLQWARSSIRKKLDMSGQQEPIKSTPVKGKDDAEEEKVKAQETAVLVDIEQPPSSLVLNIDQKDSLTIPHLTNGKSEENVDSSQSSTQSSPIPSPERHTITHGDPLGALDTINEVSKPTTQSVASPASVQVSPLKPFVLPDPNVRLFTNDRSTSNSDTSTEDSNSSSDDDSSEESESEEESDHSHDNNSSSASRLSIRYQFPNSACLFIVGSCLTLIITHDNGVAYLIRFIYHTSLNFLSNLIIYLGLILSLLSYHFVLFFEIIVVYLGAYYLLCMQSLCWRSMEFAQTGFPCQLGRSSFGHGPEFSQV